MQGDTDTDPLINRHTYSGAWGVRSEAGGLLDMRARMYDPDLGRFLSRDPLVDLSGLPYQYANSNPIGNIDPYGLCSVGPIRIGFLSNDDNSCRGAGVARTVKDVSGDIATGAAVVGGVAAGGALLVASCAATCTGVAVGALFVSTTSGSVHAAIECVDGGPFAGCALDVA